MRVKVMRKFIDKNTGKLHKVGETLTITADRFKEISKVDSNLVQEIQEAAATAETETGTAATKTASRTRTKKKSEDE